MPDRSMNLRNARRQVAQAEKRVAAQRNMVSRLIADGDSRQTVDSARALLDAFEKSLDAMRHHLAIEEKENAGLGPSRG